MNDDDLSAKILADWAKLPMPPEDYMKLARKRAKSRRLWKEYIEDVWDTGDTDDPSLKELKPMFDSMIYEERMRLQINIYKVMARDINPN